MKKVLTVLTAILLILFSGCDRKNTPKEEPAQTTVTRDAAPGAESPDESVREPDSGSDPEHGTESENGTETETNPETTEETGNGAIELPFIPAG